MAKTISFPVLNTSVTIVIQAWQENDAYYSAPLDFACFDLEFQHRIRDAYAKLNLAWLSEKQIPDEV